LPGWKGNCITSDSSEKRRGTASTICILPSHADTLPSCSPTLASPGGLRITAKNILGSFRKSPRSKRSVLSRRPRRRKIPYGAETWPTGSTKRCRLVCPGLHNVSTGTLLRMHEALSVQRTISAVSNEVRAWQRLSMSAAAAWVPRGPLNAEAHACTHPANHLCHLRQGAYDCSLVRADEHLLQGEGARILKTLSCRLRTAPLLKPISRARVGAVGR